MRITPSVVGSIDDNARHRRQSITAPVAAFAGSHTEPVTVPRAAQDPDLRDLAERSEPMRAGGRMGDERPAFNLDPLIGFGHRPGQHVGLAVERGDQTVDAVVSEDRCELRAAGRDFADRAVEIDVGNQPAFAVCDASCSRL